MATSWENKMADIPVVDFSCMGIDKQTIPDYNSPDERLRNLAQEVYDAFTTIGFVYIKNHGIEEEKIANLFQVTGRFFELPNELKAQSARPEHGTNQGWVAPEREKLSPDRPGDFKEAFNIMETSNDSLPWPAVDRTIFRETVSDFFDTCKKLTGRVLDVISLGMHLEDKTFLKRMHKDMGSGQNSTALRILYYPAINGKLKEGQTRCGEHSDYGTITLLFQDTVGGLEVRIQYKPRVRQWTLPESASLVQVRSRKDTFIPARPIKGTILVNIADLMQRWTNDKLISTKHRVVVPEEESLCSTVRRSAAFFVHPNDDAVIECLDGSGNYPPITALEYLNRRFAATYI